jgi:hypothetical protein
VQGSRAEFADGTFTATVDLALGENVVVATAWDAAGNSASAQIVVTRVAPSSGVSGVITDGLSGDPVKGVRLRFSDGETTAFTDGNGAFELELSPGRWRAVASKAGYENQTFAFEVEEGGELARVELQLQPLGVGDEVADEGGGSDAAPSASEEGCGCGTGGVGSMMLLALMVRRRTPRAAACRQVASP